MITDSVLGKTPAVSQNSDFLNTKKSPEEGLKSIDFGSLMEESSRIRKEELDTEAKATKGEFKVGESTSDKEFRENLEKITGKRQDKLKNKLEKEDYINLMVTQLKYQDPTKPMDNQQMATQLAQFNTVEQLMGVNKLLTAMSSTQNELKADKLTQYLGKTVKVEGNSLKLNSDGSVNSAWMDLAGGAGASSVQIKDANGGVVRTLSLGTKEAGEHEIKWDGLDEKGGKAPAGKYTFSIDANSVDGKPVTSKAIISGRVEGITDIANGGKLDTTAGIFTTDKILSIRDSQTAKDNMPNHFKNGLNNSVANPANNPSNSKDLNSLNRRQPGIASTASSPGNSSVNQAATTALPAEQAAPKIADQAVPPLKGDTPSEKSKVASKAVNTNASNSVLPVQNNEKPPVKAATSHPRPSTAAKPKQAENNKKA